MIAETETASAVQVAVDAPIKFQLTYLQNVDFKVRRGDLIHVPLGPRKVKGVVIGPTPARPAVTAPTTEKKFELKSILSIDDEWPKLKDPFLKWLEWVANYYAYPLGQVAQLCFPPLKKSSQARASKRSSVVPNMKPRAEHPPTDEQRKCIAEIKK